MSICKRRVKEELREKKKKRALNNGALAGGVELLCPAGGNAEKEKNTRSIKS